MMQGRPMGPGQGQQGGPQGMPRFPNQNQWNPRQNGPRPMPNGPPGPPQRPMVNIFFNSLTCFQKIPSCSKGIPVKKNVTIERAFVSKIFNLLVSTRWNATWTSG